MNAGTHTQTTAVACGVGKSSMQRMTIVVIRVKELEDKMEKISVLVKRPGEIPRHVWMSNTLENMQRYVGGYIETVTIADHLVIICNEEGWLDGLPYNCSIMGTDFVGDIIMCGVDGDEFADLPCRWDTLKVLFPKLWEEGNGYGRFDKPTGGD